MKAQRTMFVTLAIALSAILVGGNAKAAPLENPPGVCWKHTVENTSLPIIRPDIKSFCWHLWGAVNHLKQGRNKDALAGFMDAERAASAIQDETQRNLALDEARGAIALAVEKDDWRYALALLDPARNKSKRDVLAMERAYMLARLEFFPEAAAEFEKAKRDLPEHWCPDTDSDYRFVQSRASGASIRNKAELDLPSYLPYRDNKGECPSGKASAVRMPRGQTFSVNFDSGKSRSQASSEAAIAAMAERIVNAPYENRDPSKWRWLLVGHTDEQCFPRRLEFCRSDNRRLSRERAEYVQSRLEEKLQKANISGISFQIDPRGMDAPVYPKGRNQPDQRNRRVYLTPEPANTVSAGATLQCPWEVTVIRTDLPQDMHGGGVASYPREVVRPGIIPVKGQVAFSIRLIAEAAGPSMRHFYAVSENPATEILDLGGLAGLTSSEIAALVPRKGYLLADGREFMTDRNVREETISLYVTERPVSGWEELRSASAMNLSSNSRGAIETTGRHSLVMADGKPASMAVLRYKAWGAHGGYVSDASPAARVLQAQARGGAVSSPQIASPPPPAEDRRHKPASQSRPLIAQCSFTFQVQ